MKNPLVMRSRSCYDADMNEREDLLLRAQRIEPPLKRYEDMSPVDFLLLRERLGMGRYRKTTKRD